LGALGLAIERSRLRAELSQEELAARSEIHSTHVRGLERGVRNPTYKTLVQVAAGLGMTVGELTALADEIFDGLPRGRRKS
jgi:transcriptional regulator with XRE-family HTH domain